MGGVTGVTCVRVLQNGTNPDPETPPPSRSRSQRGEAEASGSQSRDQYLLSGFEVVLVPWWGMDPGSIISQFLSRNSNKITRNKRSCAATGPAVPPDEGTLTDVCGAGWSRDGRLLLLWVTLDRLLRAWWFCCTKISPVCL